MRALGRAIGDAFGFVGRTFKALFSLLWGFMVIFSFIVNLVLIVVVAILGVLIFNIKNDVADPLLKGLHSSFVGLDEATIDWTIPVRDSVDATFDLPLAQDTVVVLTAPVPLTVSADISGPVSINNATVALTLPEGTRLPVALDLIVPVDEEIPVNLDVRAVIPLAETQLHDPFENLKLTFEPIILALDNLPNNFGEAYADASATVAGVPPNLFDEGGSPYIQDPWLGFSRTAGLGYGLLGESRTLNTPLTIFDYQPGVSGVLETEIEVQGGIPALDQQVRGELYGEQAGGPGGANATAIETLQTRGVPAGAYTGDFDSLEVEGGAAPVNNAQSTEGDGTAIGGPTDDLPFVNEDGELIPDPNPQPLFTEEPPAGN
ncbi:MAG: hypothetical protein AAFV33_00330 [Chloroflexota bacterium]